MDSQSAGEPPARRLPHRGAWTADRLSRWATSWLAFPFATLASIASASAQAANVVTGFVVERPSAGFEGPWNLPSNLPYATAAGTHEMDARHISLWIKPTESWTKGIIPIWELRAPTGQRLAAGLAIR